MKSFIPVILLVVQLLQAGSLTLLQGETLDIPLTGYRSVRFAVPQHQSDGASLSGTILITPDTASVEMILLHIDDYLRWRANSEPVDTLQYIRQPSGRFQMGVPGLGSYALIISNRGDYRPASIVLDVDVHFAGSGRTGDPLPAALRIALLMMMAGAVAVAVGSVLSKHFYKRKKSA